VILVAALRDRPRSEAQQQLYEQAVYGLGLASAARSAPTLLLALEGGLPDQAASDPRWLATVLDTLSDEARTDLDGPALADNDFALDPARRTILRALEADDVAYARQVIEALRAWVASESDQLEPTPRPPSDEPPGE